MAQSDCSAKGQSPLSLNPKTGWPTFLGLYSAMVHVSQTDIVTVFTVDTKNMAIAIPYYEPGHTGSSYYLPTASVAANQSPEQAAHSELLRSTGYRAPKLHVLGRLLVEIDKRIATTYLYLARQASNNLGTQPDDASTSKPRSIPIATLSDMLACGAFPVEVHSVAVTRALRLMNEFPDPRHA